MTMPVTTDHDLLVTLDTKFEVFTKQYAVDIKELKDGTATTLAKHEVAISDNAKQISEIKQELRDYKTKISMFRWVTGLVSAAIMFLLTQLPGLLRSWGIIK